jgi:EpsI family protein
MMFGRTLVLSACLAFMSGYLSWANGAEILPSRLTFSEFPSEISGWSGRSAPEFSKEVLATLALDDHLNRFYTAGERFGHVFIAYYQSQREGASLHSPLNCLPGAGWLPISNSHLDIPVTRAPDAGAVTRSITVNRYVIQKGPDKQLVLYWYQSHGRVISSEYWSKAYLVVDSMRFNRTDAALVRITVPIRDADSAPETTAEGTAVEISQAMFPFLESFVPS